MIILLALAILIGFIVLRIWRLRPTRCTPEALANLLLRQPDRFFVIVPWYLVNHRRLNKELLPFMNDAAKLWGEAGDFGQQADTLIAFVELYEKHSADHLHKLLNLVFEESNPLIRAVDAQVAEAEVPHCLLAAKCLEVARMVIGSKEASKEDLPKPKDMFELFQSAKSHHGLKTPRYKNSRPSGRQSKLMTWIFGDLNDFQIIQDWYTLLTALASEIDQTYWRCLNRTGDKVPIPKDSHGARIVRTLPGEKDLPFLYFILLAVFEARADLKAKDQKFKRKALR
jgi:hypothetical protein